MAKRIKTSSIFDQLLNKKIVPILVDYEPFKELLKYGTSKKMDDLIERLDKLIFIEKDHILTIKNLNKEKKRTTAKVLYYSGQVNSDSGTEADMKKLEQERKIINETNQEIDERREKMEEILVEKEQLNLELLKETVSYCYNRMEKDEKELDIILEDIEKIRKELEVKRIKRDELEDRVNSTYSFIHSLLGSNATQKIDSKLADDK